MLLVSETTNIAYYSLTFTISVFPYFSNETVHVVKSSDILSIVAS